MHFHSVLLLLYCCKRSQSYLPYYPLVLCYQFVFFPLTPQLFERVFKIFQQVRAFCLQIFDVNFYIVIKECFLFWFFLGGEFWGLFCGHLKRRCSLVLLFIMWLSSLLALLIFFPTRLVKLWRWIFLFVFGIL